MNMIASTSPRDRHKTTAPPRHWVIIAAAGIGKRLGGNIPKQYLPLHGKTVIEHTLTCFLTYPRFSKIVVALREQDPHWPTLALAQHPQIMTTLGGEERCHSVLNALESLANDAAEQDWVLVHDAARPCLQHSDLDQLLSKLADHSVGGLLAVPVRDTIKKAGNNHQVIATLDRKLLWQAYTPQMFRYGLLYAALRASIHAGNLVTDEAAAIEATGAQPLLIAGRRDNIKITDASDLALAEFYLAAQNIV